MIIKFNLFENVENSYLLDLDELYRTYEENFDELYPEVETRKKDVKLRGSYFKKDIIKILKGKEVELNIYDNNMNKHTFEGIISNVWVNYNISGFHSKWKYKFKLSKEYVYPGVMYDNNWIVVKNNIIKVLNDHGKTELEEKLGFISASKKYNL